MLVRRLTSLGILGLFTALPAWGCKERGNGFVETQRGDAGIVTSRDAGRDAGGDRLDGSVDLDGATMDAAVLGVDGGLELPMGSLILPNDGGILLPDGAIIDLETALERYRPEVDLSTCEIGTADMWSAQVEFSAQGGFSLVPGRTGFGLAYAAADGRNCISGGVSVLAIPESTGFGDAVSILPYCQNVEDVALVPTADGYRVAWVDNHTDSDELHSWALDHDLEPIERDGRSQVNAEDAVTEPERSPVLTEVEGRVLAAWITRGGFAQAHTIHARVLDGQAGVVEVVAQSEGHQPRALAIATLGPGVVGLVWVTDEGEHPGIWLQRLDGTGQPIDAPQRLHEAVSADSTAAIASHLDDEGVIDGGAIVYAIAFNSVPQVQFQQLDDEGLLVGTDRAVVERPQQGTAPSIHTVADGYVVTYRALPAGGIATSEVRLLFLTEEGAALSKDESGRSLSFPVAPCDTGNSRTTVAVSPQGEVMVAWVDGDPSAPSSKLLKLVRRPLNCQ